MNSIEGFINRELTNSDKDIALSFVKFLRENEMNFVRDTDFWKKKIYYLVKFHDKCACFISINDPDETENHWTVWSDDIDSDFLDTVCIDERLKELAWKHADNCGRCGSCSGGRRKSIFGKVFDNVCVCTFRIDNPNYEDLEFLKKMIEIRKAEIIKSERSVR